MFNFLRFLPSRFVLLEIRFPRIFDLGAANEEKLAAMEHFYNSLSVIKPYLVFEVAIPEKGTEIGLFIVVPEKFRDTVEKQVSGFFPEAEIEAVNDFDVINKQGVVSGAVLKLKNNGEAPLQTYKKLKISALGLITDAISSLKKAGEGAVFQILIKPREKNLFETNIRIISSAETREKADKILSDIEDTFTQFEFPGFDAFYSFRPQGETLEKLIHNFSFRLFNKKETAWFSAEELTGVFHWPIIKIEAPRMRFLEAKSAPPPSVSPIAGITLGKNHFRGQETIIKLSSLDRRRHIHVAGQSTTGKKQFLLNLIKQDINGGAGIGVIDSDGDLIEMVSKSVPRFRRKDLIAFDAVNYKGRFVDFGDIINNGKILLVKNDSFLGPVIISELRAAAAKRVEKPSRISQRDFYLYVNGTYNFANNFFTTTLPEFQKGHINLTLADEGNIYDNIGSFIVFRTKPEDAKLLTRHFGSVFNEADLISVNNNYAYAKLLIGDAITTPFTIKIED